MSKNITLKNTESSNGLYTLLTTGQLVGLDKDLANHFIDCFNIDMDKSTYFFAVADKPNEKGAFLIELK